MSPPNALADSPSTYLRQHAAQPVHWQPWREDVLAAARARHKPLLLSIGYAACHWCARMAHESFDDPALAALINEHFVAIKIDREQRPDLDAIYQSAHRRLRRGPGGWPLTVFCAPDGLPFYSGTYFAPDLFREVLNSVARVWREQPDKLAQQDRALRAALHDELPRLDEHAVLDASVRDQAREQLAGAYDATHGGFGDAPKFPHPSDLAFLLARGRDEGDAGALDMALSTLRRMAEGGLYDQLGGGFFRYSVDAEWKLPHFEKLLTDSGILLALYADALALTGEPLLRRVVEDTAGWALREMRLADGSFAASLSADDAEGKEGGHYLWDAEPLRLALSPNEWDVCAAHWGLVDAPAWTAPVGARWHLRIARDTAALARTLGRPQATLDDLVASAREKLLAVRRQRPAAPRDELSPTAANALMITGLARAGAVCGRDDWLAAARAALAALRATRVVDGRLLALPGQDGFLDDHAFLLEAVLALHAAAPHDEDLPFAGWLDDTLLSEFEDCADGGFWQTRHSAPPFFLRLKPGLDAATPSGNGTAALALQALGRRIEAPHRFAAADRCVRLFAAQVREDPASHTRLLQAALAA